MKIFNHIGFCEPHYKKIKPNKAYSVKKIIFTNSQCAVKDCSRKPMLFIKFKFNLRKKIFMKYMHLKIKSLFRKLFTKDGREYGRMKNM